MKLKTLAFPAIATGFFSYPLDKCGDVFVKTIYEYFDEENKGTSLKKVSCTIIDDLTLNEFLKAFDRKFPVKTED